MDSPVLYLKNCNAPRIAWNVYAYSLVASLGSFVYGYNTGIIAPAIIFIRKSFTPEPSAADVGAIVSIILVGAAIGSFLSGNMADRFGRVKLMTLNSGFMMLAAVTSCLGTSARIIFVARFLLGIGVGVASVVPGLYITEIAPTHVRGRLGALNQLFGWTGVIVAYFVGYEIVNCTAGIGLCWRYMFASGGVLCVAHMVSFFPLVFYNHQFGKPIMQVPIDRKKFR